MHQTERQLPCSRPCAQQDTQLPVSPLLGRNSLPSREFTGSYLRYGVAASEPWAGQGDGAQGPQAAILLAFSDSLPACQSSSAQYRAGSSGGQAGAGKSASAHSREWVQGGWGLVFQPLLTSWSSQLHTMQSCSGVQVETWFPAPIHPLELPAPFWKLVAATGGRDLLNPSTDWLPAPGGEPGTEQCQYRGQKAPCLPWPPAP